MIAGGKMANMPSVDILHYFWTFLGLIYNLAIIVDPGKRRNVDSKTSNLSSIVWQYLKSSTLTAVTVLFGLTEIPRRLASFIGHYYGNHLDTLEVCENSLRRPIS